MIRPDKITGNTRRFHGGVRSASSVASLSLRDRVLISTCIILITAIAWAYIVYLERQMSSAASYETMMAKMGMTQNRPWTFADLFFTSVMWAVMMVGMMGAAAAPVLLLFAAARMRSGERRVPLAVFVFGLGYIVIWFAFSAGAAVAQTALQHAGMVSAAMTASSPHLAGTILLAAGIYQFTSLKGACLAHCRSPLGFLMSNWRDGTFGAFSMGFRHGAYCLGCCWALMCLLFAVGVMNLVWVAALTILVLFEKVGPAGTLVARVAGATMVGFGLLYLAGVVPAPVP
jgi:predicted metal-binding membrane protein